MSQDVPQATRFDGNDHAFEGDAPLILERFVSHDFRRKNSTRQRYLRICLLSPDVASVRAASLRTAVSGCSKFSRTKCLNSRCAEKIDPGATGVARLNLQATGVGPADGEADASPSTPVHTVLRGIHETATHTMLGSKK